MYLLSLFPNLLKRTGHRITVGLLFSSISALAVGEPIFVTFNATYTAATCDISVPSSVNFNQEEYAGGVPVSSVYGDNIQQSFAIRFSHCVNNSFPEATPKITVTGNVTAFGDEKLFSSNNGLPGEAVGYGVKLSTVGNLFFNPADNLAESEIITATNTTTIAMLNNQELPMKAVLSCGPNNCADGTAGTFKAAVTFTLSYE